MDCQWICRHQRPWKRFHPWAILDSGWAGCVVVGRYAGNGRRESPTWATQVDSPKSLTGTVDCRQLSAKVMLVPQQCTEASLNHPPEPNISFHCESLTLAMQFRPLWTSWASSHGPWLKTLNFLWKSKPVEEIVVQSGDPKVFLEDFMASLMVVAENSSD